MATKPTTEATIAPPSEHPKTREAIENLNRLTQRLAAIRAELNSKTGDALDVPAMSRRQREVEAARLGKPLPADPPDNRPALMREQQILVEAIVQQRKTVGELTDAVSREVSEPLRGEYARRVKRIVAALLELRAAAAAERELRQSVEEAGWSWVGPACLVKPSIVGYQRLTHDCYAGRFISDAVHDGVISAAEAKAAGLESA